MYRCVTIQYLGLVNSLVASSCLDQSSRASLYTTGFFSPALLGLVDDHRIRPLHFRLLYCHHEG